MILAALDAEFGFRGRAFDYTMVEPVCAALRVAGGPTIAACPPLGQPWSRLTPYLLDRELLIAMHHAAAERHVLRHLGLPFPDGHCWDCECAERVLHISRDGDLVRDKPLTNLGPYTLLNCLARRGIRNRPAEEKQAFQDKIGTLRFAESELPAIVAYCTEDVKNTLTLARLQVQDFRAIGDGMLDLFLHLCLPHALRVADMVAKGLVFDRQSYEQIVANQEPLLRGKQQELQRLGFVGEFHHPQEKLTVAPQNLAVRRTLKNLGLGHVLEAARVYKTDQEKGEDEQRRSLAGIFAEGHKSPFPFIRIAKSYHDLIDLVSRDWTAFIDHDGRIRPAVVFPGSSSYRTIQVMPHPLMLPYFGRPFFHAAAGHVLVAVDFKCQELGLAADWYGDPVLLSIYNTFAKDVYCEIGAAMGLYPVEPGQPADPRTDPPLRTTLKTAILGLQYGERPRALSGQLNLPTDQARKIFDRFWATFAKLAEGRKIYLDHIQREGVAINRAGFVRRYRPFQRRQGRFEEATLSYANFPVQSGASAVLMLALAALPDWTNPVLTMHDAVLLEVPQDGVRDAAEAAQQAMASALHALFPQLRSRCEIQAAWRYHKGSPGSLHAFCEKLGLLLPGEVGWEAPANLFREGTLSPSPFPLPLSLPSL